MKEQYLEEALKKYPGAENDYVAIDLLITETQLALANADQNKPAFANLRDKFLDLKNIRSEIAEKLFQKSLVK